MVYKSQNNKLSFRKVWSVRVWPEKTLIPALRTLTAFPTKEFLCAADGAVRSTGDRAGAHTRANIATNSMRQVAHVVIEQLSCFPMSSLRSLYHVLDKLRSGVATVPP